MATNAEYLRGVPIFRQIADRSLARFAESCTRMQLEPEQVLIEEGDAGFAMYVVVSGRVRIERLTASGEVQVLGVRGTGEVIGEMSLIDGRPREARVIAISRCKLLVLHHAQFAELIQQEPSASLAIMQSLSLRLREADNVLLSLRSQEVHERLLEYLKRNAVEGFVILSMTQTALAEHLGCKRETVSRAFTFLEKEGLIQRESRSSVRLV